MVTRYVTRWALTQGILQIEGEYTEDGKYFIQTNARFARIVVRNDEAFERLEHALARAQQMAKHKITLLEKQIKRLESFKAKVVNRRDG